MQTREEASRPSNPPYPAVSNAGKGPHPIMPNELKTILKLCIIVLLQYQ
jgi:hypothetical protein